MNVNPYNTTEYENKRDWTIGQNKPNSNPIKPNFFKGQNRLPENPATPLFSPESFITCPGWGFRLYYQAWIYKRDKNNERTGRNRIVR